MTRSQRVYRSGSLFHSYHHHDGPLLHDGYPWHYHDAMGMMLIEGKADARRVVSPEDADYWSGYGAAIADMRMLVGKVPESRKLGVILAWLHEGGEDGHA